MQPASVQGAPPHFLPFPRVQEKARIARLEPEGHWREGRTSDVVGSKNKEVQRNTHHEMLAIFLAFLGYGEKGSFSAHPCHEQATTPPGVLLNMILVGSTSRRLVGADGRDWGHLAGYLDISTLRKQVSRQGTPWKALGALYIR